VIQNGLRQTTSSLTRRAFLQHSAAVLSTLGVSRRFGFAATQPASATAAKVRFGVNYVPRRHWWYCWLNWDQQSIAEDLEAVAALGMDHIRIQCLWPFFQPGINYINETVLDRLHALLDCADRAGLDVEITVLNGFMSGLFFMPPWVEPLAKKSNIFSSPEIIEAEKLLFRRIAERIGSHPRFLGFDLGNEIDVAMAIDPATPAQADAWANDMFVFCNEVAPGKFHVNGVDHAPWFSDSRFTRENLATAGSATVVHSYALFTGALERYGYSGTGTLHLVEYMVELAYAYHTDLARRVWVEEVGVSPDWVPGSYLLGYADQVIRNAVSTGKVWGITWWCSHDLDPAIKGFNQLEYSLGLLGQDNQPKPLGKKLASLIREFRSAPAQVTAREIALVIPDRGLAPKPSPPDWSFGDPYMKLIAQGKKPAIVLQSRAQDDAYLRSRGIKELIRLG
jgi:hypothetical protein